MNRISDVTKRDLYDLFNDGLQETGLFAEVIRYPYYGRLGELEFLERIYDLDSMPSSDSRYINAREDIIQHTINNDDYPYCWVFQDSRFQLMDGPDEIILRFLCEVFHPFVRDENMEWEKILQRVNELIRADEYELYIKEYVSGRAVYAYRLCGAEVAVLMDNNAIIDLIDEFKSGLIAKATDGNIDEKEYKRCRDTLLQIPQLKEHLPPFLKSNRTAKDFRRYMQGQEQHYADRRQVITKGMDDLIALLETSSDPFLQMKDYKQLERLGRGGYGEVYRYHNECLDMDFAVKIYEPIFVSQEEQLEGEKRFFREAKILFSLNNNHIVRLYDAGRLDGKPYIRMELIDGYDLNQLHVKEGNLDFSRSAHVVLHILLGLKCAHDHGIIHRDLKPSNVVYSSSEKMFKIIDFGISAFMDTENYTRLTKTGERVAGGIYIDPALQENPRLRDPRSDIYSVGAIWYFLLSGKAPSGSDMRSYLKQANNQLSEGNINVVMKCLSSKIEDRFDSCAQLIQLVKPYIKP